MGTATYFSPEQAQGIAVDGRSDVYSLGVVLYEMDTGAAPFTGDSPVAVAYKHVREAPAPASQRNPDVPPDLDQIINTALAKNPDERYQTADDMRADLLRFQRGRPLAAAPVTAMVAEVPTSATAAAGAGAYAATMASPRVDDRGRVVGAPTYEGRKRSNTVLITVLTILGLAALIAAILFAATKMGSSQKVTVPNVVGQKVSDATAALRKQHLDPVVKRVISPSVPLDIVISQKPGASKKVTRNSQVTLTVSNGAEQVQIPLDIKNKPEQEATDELKLLGFDVRSEPRESDNVDKGNVIDSNPAAGTNAGKGSVVTLLVSSGRAPQAIPDVKGSSQDAAFNQLQQQGFTNIQPQQENSDTVPAGQATRTDPAAGTKIPTDQRITLYISSGKKQFTVPSVVGVKYADAKTQLEGQGFTVGRVNIVDDSNVGVVVDQSPAGNSQVTTKGLVTLRVGVASSSPSTTTTPTTAGP
jgi:serine/threonine-protein kinase